MLNLKKHNPPLILRVYGFISAIIEPLCCLVIGGGALCFRGRKSKRCRNLLALTKAERPAGTLFWFHAESVGEVNSILPLIGLLKNTTQDAYFLVTVSTKLAMAVLNKANLPYIILQYCPLDVPFVVARFLAYWKPNIACFVDSAILPNIILQIRKYCRLILLNGRLSDRTFRRWKCFRVVLRYLLSQYYHVIAGSETDQQRFAEFYQDNLSHIGNLKYVKMSMSDIEENALKILREEVKERSLFLCASLHKGEEQVVISIHAELSKRYPNLLTIIVPRHLPFGKEIVDYAQRYRLNAVLKSCEKNIPANCDIYVADTAGELKIFYSLTKFAFVGGSFVPRGGHNVIEPLQVGCIPIVGQYTANFTDIVSRMEQASVLVVAKGQAELENIVEGFLKDTNTINKYRSNLYKVMPNGQEILNKTASLISEALLAAPSTTPK